MQLEFVLASILYFLFIDGKFFELASPKQKLNSKQSILLSSSIISKHSDVNISFLNIISAT